MAQPNFQYEKRQRDLLKKKKQDEKRQRKLDKAKVQPDEGQGALASPAKTDDGAQNE